MKVTPTMHIGSTHLWSLTSTGPSALETQNSYSTILPSGSEDTFPTSLRLPDSSPSTEFTLLPPWMSFGLCQTLPPALFPCIRFLATPDQPIWFTTASLSLCPGPLKLPLTMFFLPVSNFLKEESKHATSFHDYRFTSQTASHSSDFLMPNRWLLSSLLI